MSAMNTSQSTMQPANLASELKPQGQATQKVKPCCVCTDEKSKRDECMLFSKGDNPQQECQDLVSRYKSCMAGYGFTIN